MPRRALALALALLAPSGCTGARYVAQAACGQVDLMLRARPLERAARDPGEPPHVRALLAAVPEIKRFGERHGLRPTGNYRRYVPLDRPSVVYVVGASEPLAFRSKTWWFPIVGRVPYLGWFDRDEAVAFADELRAEGLDADMYGAEAYSTLGFFEDPVLSSMLSDRPDAIASLADVVLHESVHATLFLDGQTTFNESVAELVAFPMARAYVDERFGSASAERRALDEMGRRDDDRREKMHAAYDVLAKLYASDRPAADKLAEKRRVLAELRRTARFRREINNVTLAAFKNYNSGKAELSTLLDACGGSFPRFLGALRTVTPAAFTRPNQRELGPVVEPLVKAGCPAG